MINKKSSFLLHWERKRFLTIKQINSLISISNFQFNYEVISIYIFVSHRFDLSLRFQKHLWTSKQSLSKVTFIEMFSWRKSVLIFYLSFNSQLLKSCLETRSVRNWLRYHFSMNLIVNNTFSTFQDIFVVIFVICAVQNKSCMFTYFSWKTSTWLGRWTVARNMSGLEPHWKWRNCMCFKFDLSGPGLIPAGEILLPCQRKKSRKRKRFTWKLVVNILNVNR